ncbi:MULTISPECIES: immunity 49 family protein [unclassified Streptomyces]|uniref:immunity 49 family protein n=1 Tax=unclassified Streptomyces TaxID=2593676 RepID=UPI002E823A47|nr:immunity 49 family protein [Streptomyces sp. NBC_00589]WTI39652.1 immunity 49 family protein [Streptomyces sp. NBC_00775]WUB26669.1 immunity 49 family protein [Streptomyces sp. NBC_00589]
MTARIDRHELPTGPEAEQFTERLNKHLSKKVDRLEESTSTIDLTFNTSILNLRAHCVIDPRAAAVETWEAAVTAMQLGSALFAVTGVSEGTIECRIDREVRSLRAVGPLSTADAGTWLQAFWLAVICREQERMTQLCEIPLERLRAPEGQYDAYIYHWVDTLQTYWLRRPGLVEKLTATFEASDPAVARIAPRDLLDAQLYPPINLFYHFVRKDEEGFSPALVEALKLHKMYWTLNEDREADIDGTIALGPLAIACLAYDGGIPIEVESDYLPKHLLQHDWLGEFPT